MSDETGDKPLWSKLVVWIVYAPLTLLLLAFLAIEMAGEWMRIGWWHLKCFAGKALLDDRPPPGVWTLPPKPRKGW